MNRQSETNKKAWSYKAYDFWNTELGLPVDVAEDMVKQPEKHLRKHLGYLGDVKDKKIINLLGSCGKKAGVNITYIISDFLELTGDYFENTLQIGEVAHAKFYPDNERNEFPKCLLRYWTMGEIISSFASAGFIHYESPPEEQNMTMLVDMINAM